MSYWWQITIEKTDKDIAERVDYIADKVSNTKRAVKETVQLLAEVIELAYRVKDRGLMVGIDKHCLQLAARILELIIDIKLLLRPPETESCSHGTFYRNTDEPMHCINCGANCTWVNTVHVDCAGLVETKAILIDDILVDVFTIIDNQGDCGWFRCNNCGSLDSFDVTTHDGMALCPHNKVVVLYCSICEQEAKCNCEES